MKYDVIIGLEIHAQLKTKSKMFCRCSNDGENKSPNSTICEVCTGQPGALPYPNQKAIEWTILTGLALNCQIAQETKFDRKNYFYPDLPKGYQISQYDQPIAYDGHLEIRGQKIKIVRIHLEEDTGKLFHPQGANYSLVDFNRSGSPLMELVTAPDIKDAQTAKEFCQEYQKILRYLDVAWADMEKGQMRCEANVSLQKKGKWERKGNEIVPQEGYKLNPKVELKNINSFRAMQRAIEYEIKRQAKVLDEGGQLVQETRGWDEARQKTYRQRSKESAHDYRYFPEPDIPPLSLGEILEQAKKKLPELPQAKERRFVTEYGFGKAEAKILAAEKETASFVEKVISELRAWLLALDEVDGGEKEVWESNKKKLAKLVASWFINKLGKLLNADNKKISQVSLTPENFAEFLTLIYQNRVNASAAQKILEIMYKEGRDPSDILEEGDFEQISDSSQLEEAVQKALDNSPQAVEEYKKGKVNAIQYLVGQVMKETRGKADPQAVRKMLEEKLS